jgi:Protein of unknown function (DUF4240)
MTESDFWTLIDEARNKAGNTKAIPVWLEEHLSKQSPSEIMDFGAWLSMFMCRAHDERLWAAAGIVAGGLSNDGFVYFKCWLIAQGKAVYEAAVSNPDSLADLEFQHRDIFGPVISLEMLMYAYAWAYNKKTGKPKYSPAEPPAGWVAPFGCQPNDGSGLKNEGLFIKARRDEKETETLLKTSFPRLVQRFAARSHTLDSACQS